MTISRSLFESQSLKSWPEPQPRLRRPLGAPFESHARLAENKEDASEPEQVDIRTRLAQWQLEHGEKAEAGILRELQSVDDAMGGTPRDPFDYRARSSPGDVDEAGTADEPPDQPELWYYGATPQPGDLAEVSYVKSSS